MDWGGFNRDWRYCCLYGLESVCGTRPGLVKIQECKTFLFLVGFIVQALAFLEGSAFQEPLNR